MKNRWTDQEAQTVRDEAVRLCRHDPLITLHDALYRAQALLPQERRKKQFTDHYKKALLQRSEQEIKRQLDASLPKQFPLTIEKPKESEREVQLAAQLEEQHQTFKATLEDMQAQLQARNGELETATIKLSLAEDDLSKLRPAAEQMLALTHLFQAFGHSLARGAGTQLAALVGVTSEPHKGNGKASGGMPAGTVKIEPQSLGRSAEEEAEDAQRDLEAAVKAGQVRAREERAQSIEQRSGHLPAKFRRPSVAVVGLPIQEQSRCHSEFGKEMDIIYLPNRGNTKRVADTALMRDRIFTMNKFIPMDFVKAAQKGDCVQITGGYSHLASKLRDTLDKARRAPAHH